MKVLLDTSVIVRFCQTGDQKHQLAVDAVARLSELGHQACIVPQVIYELWSVATRPTKANGLGWSTVDAKQEVDRLEKLFVFLKDERTIYSFWIELVSSFSVGGRDSHDARLVAAMDRHAITHLMTLDQNDFKRFSHKTVWFPDDVLAIQPGD
ncbi:MAG: type II toxin-antitoxin system VapC family toxin [Planctomycetota bacterium]